MSFPYTWYLSFERSEYFDWYNQRATSLSEERNITFFKNKVAQMDPEVNHQDIKEKVLSVDKIAEPCRKTPERMTKDQEETQLLLQTMYDTATRISGMTRLEWRDVFRTEFAGEQLADNELVISSDRSKSEDSGIVELTDDTLRRLNQHRQQVTPTDTHQKVFFPAIQCDSAYDKIYSSFKDTAEKIGVPEASPHWFRHSRLTHLGLQMLEDGHSYPEIKERLRAYGRHRNGETTEIYIKILKNRKQERISKYSTVEWGSR